MLVRNIARILGGFRTTMVLWTSNTTALDTGSQLFGLNEDLGDDLDDWRAIADSLSHAGRRRERYSSDAPAAPAPRDCQLETQGFGHQQYNSPVVDGGAP